MARQLQKQKKRGSLDSTQIEAAKARRAYTMLAAVCATLSLSISWLFE
jgi:hypothetical protein